jgi:hypothetical protein
LQIYQGEPDVEVDIHITSTKELNALKAQAESDDDDIDDNENFYEDAPTSRLGSANKTNERKTSATLLPMRKMSAIQPAKSTGEPLMSNSLIFKNNKSQNDDMNYVTGRFDHKTSWTNSNFNLRL